MSACPLYPDDFSKCRYQSNCRGFHEVARYGSAAQLRQSIAVNVIQVTAVKRLAARLSRCVDGARAAMAIKKRDNLQEALKRLDSETIEHGQENVPLAPV